MNIMELAKNGANVSVNISVNDLKEFLAEMIAESAAKPQETEEKFLSADEVCGVLRVSKNTLWRWNRDKYLCAVKVGRTPMYRMSDVNNLRQGKES